MDTLIRELNQRYKAVKNKTGSKFIIAVLNYLTLLERPEIQELLLSQRTAPEIHELNIWIPYQKICADVYEPYRKHPELFKKTFSHFYFLEDWLDVPIVIYLRPKGIKAVWQKMKYRNRIDAIQEDTYLDGSMTKDRYDVRILELDNQEVDLSKQLTELEKKIQLEGSGTIGQTKKAFLTGLFAEKNYLNGTDLKKKEIADILLSDATVSNQNIQAIRFKPAYQKMFEHHQNLAFCNWSG